MKNRKQPIQKVLVPISCHRYHLLKVVYCYITIEIRCAQSTIYKRLLFVMNGIRRRKCIKMSTKIYKIGICDDEETWRKEIAKLCNMKCSALKIQPKYLFFSTGEELLQSADKLDLLFLDEELPGISGQEIKEVFDEHNLNTMIIFVTSHGQILYDSFGRNVYGFLNKPVDHTRFSKLFDKLIGKLERQSYIQYFDPQKGHQYIPCSKVLYISAEGSYSRIMMCNGKNELIRKALGEIEDEITDKYLVRIHKSSIVNLMQNCTLNCETSTLTIDSDPPIILQVARRRKKELQALYVDALSERADMIWNT